MPSTTIVRFHVVRSRVRFCPRPSLAARTILVGLPTSAECDRFLLKALLPTQSKHYSDTMVVAMQRDIGQKAGVVDKKS